nr:TIM barrel protein [Maliibacterium massiliense]
MQESMRNYIHAGLIHFMAFPATTKGEGPVLETIDRVARDTYFDAIEITHIADAAVRSTVRDHLSQSAMRVYYGCQPRLLGAGANVNAVDEDARQAAMAIIRDGIDEAYALGCLGFGFLSGKYKEEEKDQAYAQLMKSVNEMCDYAAAKGDMKVALEVFDYDVDKCSLIGPAPLARKFAEEACARNSNFGLMVDLSHLPLLHEGPEESLVPVAPYIIHAHIGNAVRPELPSETPAYGDAHPRFGFPGGANNVKELAEFLRVLIQVGYLKKGAPRTVSFEVKPFGDEDPEMVIANAKRTLNAAWELV